MWTLWLSHVLIHRGMLSRPKRARIGDSNMFAGLRRTNRILVAICLQQGAMIE